MSIRRAVVWSVAGWIALAIVYAALLYTESAGAMGPAMSIRVSLASTFAPTGMGVVVWWLTGKHPWPEARFVEFGMAHTALAVAFAVVWAGWMLLLAEGPSSRMPHVALWRSVLPWHVVIGILLYGLIAGASYAVRSAFRSHDLQLAAEQERRLRVEAELAALRAHVNPHFLLNTLHSVGELWRHDRAAADRSLERLADLFRYTVRLDRQRIEIVSLEEEWKFVESYLCLEKLRMGDRLRVDTSLDDDALSCAVPPFTLQPLVENAVRHGVGPMPDGGTVAISASETNGQLVIRVSDNGAGASAEAIRASAGLGLRSVRQRLAARYGSRVSVSFESANDVGTTVTITMPADAAY
jgi:sensor histidine kinase YesM